MDAETAKSYSERLVGIKTSSGIVVKSISRHAMCRFVERDVSKEQAADILENASISYPGNTPGTSCQQKDGFRIVLNEKTGNVVSVVDLDEEDQNDFN